MKRLIALLLALLLCTFCFVACGGDDDKDKDEKPAQGDTNEEDKGEEKPSEPGSTDKGSSEVGGSDTQDPSGSGFGDVTGGDDAKEDGKLTVGEDEDGANYGEFFPV